MDGVIVGLSDCLVKRMGSDAWRGWYQGISVCTGHWLLSTFVSCLQAVGDVHPFVSKKMICKYECW